MGKKLLVALTMEGKFAGEGLQASMKTMTCSRQWRGNWSKETASAIAPTPEGPQYRTSKAVSGSSHSDDDGASIEMPSALFLSLANSGLGIHFS
jgi:hypothetical protein